MGNEATRWKKGQSGNPKGKKPGPNFRAIFRAYLDQPGDPNKSPKTRFEEAAEDLWRQGKSSPEFLLDTIKFLEGPSPRESQSETDDAADTIQQRLDKHRAKRAKAKAKRTRGSHGGGVPGQGSS